MMMFRRNAPGDVFDAIRADVYTAMEEVGATYAAKLQDLISVPVEYVTGPRGGTIVIRSKPGEPPRKDTGALYESVTPAVETDADVVTLEITSDRFYAPILEERMERYAWVPAFEDTVDEFLDRITAAFEGA